MKLDSSLWNEKNRLNMTFVRTRRLESSDTTGRGLFFVVWHRPPCAQEIRIICFVKQKSLEMEELYSHRTLKTPKDRLSRGVRDCYKLFRRLDAIGDGHTRSQTQMIRSLFNCESYAKGYYTFHSP